MWNPGGRCHGESKACCGRLEGLHSRSVRDSHSEAAAKDSPATQVEDRLCAGFISRILIRAAVFELRCRQTKGFTRAMCKHSGCYCNQLRLRITTQCISVYRSLDIYRGADMRRRHRHRGTATRIPAAFYIKRNTIHRYIRIVIHRHPLAVFHVHV